MSDLRELLERYVAARAAGDDPPTPEQLCSDRPERLQALVELIREYEALEERLDGDDFTVARSSDAPRATASAVPFPDLPGFRVIERIGAGGDGEVYKLEDLALGRMVAAKVTRGVAPLSGKLTGFLDEARSLALFEDPRIVNLLDFRSDVEPPVLLMQYVDGFELGKIGRSLEIQQRARIVQEVAEAIDYAHSRGVQHRDLKPSNIMLDARLQPKILDFGLAERRPDRGHLVGSPAYMSPEQLDPDRPIDERSDVYALGVVLYELLCGALPYAGDDVAALATAIRNGQPRLPMEVDPTVPASLQAIALKAMEADPAQRYASAAEMAGDLSRYLGGRPVTARPSVYETALDRRVGPHQEQIREWERIKLIYPHEATRLHDAYESLQVREEDWIVRGRRLSFAPIALYLGAFLAALGSGLYAGAWFQGERTDVIGPTLVLAGPCVALWLAAERLFRRERQAVAVAFHLAALALLPLYLLTLMQAWGLFDVAGDRALFGEGFASNRELQVAALATCAGAAWLGLRSRTLALGLGFTLSLSAFALTVLADLGLRGWLEEGQWDRIGLGLAPWALVAGVVAYGAERRGSPWFAQPLYVLATLLGMLAPELLAQDGKLLGLVGLTASDLQGGEVSDPRLLDTVASMTLIGVAIYALGWLMEHRGTRLVRRLAYLPYAVSPFAILAPIGFLVGSGEYSRRYDWIYLALALAVAFVSRFRQRRSFFFAGSLNAAAALLWITSHYEWFDRRVWAVLVLAVGIGSLLGGLLLHGRTREESPPPTDG